ncbi:hypothetical protein ACFL0T_06245, partial [Candidatus Omnitrophota bacterium]
MNCYIKKSISIIVCILFLSNNIATSYPSNSYKSHDTLREASLASGLSGARTEIAGDLTRPEAGKGSSAGISQGDPDTERAQGLDAFFQKNFGTLSETITDAPGRDNAQGELVASSKRGDGLIHIIHKDSGEEFKCRIDELEKYQSTAKDERDRKVSEKKRTIPTSIHHTLGTIIQAKKLAESKGKEFTGMNIALTSTVPYGAGLSNSAANCCAVSMALNNMYDMGLEKKDIVELARDGEHDDFVGGSCGYLDQIIIMYARPGFMCMIDYSKLPDIDAAVSYHESNLPKTLQRVLINTKVSRELTETEYDDRVIELELAHKILTGALGRDITSTSLSLHDIQALMQRLNGTDTPYPIGSIPWAHLDHGTKRLLKHSSLDLDDLAKIAAYVDKNYSIPTKEAGTDGQSTQERLKRHHDTSEYAKLTIRESFAILLKRMRHQFTSSVRTPLTVRALEEGDVDAFLAFIHGEGVSLRMSGDFEITGDNGAKDKLLDIGYAVAKKLGIKCAGRMEGGGGGGNVGFYVDRTSNVSYQRWLELTLKEYNEWARENLKDFEDVTPEPENGVIEPILAAGARTLKETPKSSSGGETMEFEVTRPRISMSSVKLYVDGKSLLSYEISDDSLSAEGAIEYAINYVSMTASSGLWNRERMRESLIELKTPSGERLFLINTQARGPMLIRLVQKSDTPTVNYVEGYKVLEGDTSGLPKIVDTLGKRNPTRKYWENYLYGPGVRFAETVRVLRTQGLKNKGILEAVGIAVDTVNALLEKAEIDGYGYAHDDINGDGYEISIQGTPSAAGKSSISVVVMSPEPFILGGTQAILKSNRPSRRHTAIFKQENTGRAKVVFRDLDFSSANASEVRFGLSIKVLSGAMKKDIAAVPAKSSSAGDKYEMVVAALGADEAGRRRAAMLSEVRALIAGKSFSVDDKGEALEFKGDTHTVTITIDGDPAEDTMSVSISIENHLMHRTLVGRIPFVLLSADPDDTYTEETIQQTETGALVNFRDLPTKTVSQQSVEYEVTIKSSSAGKGDECARVVAELSKNNGPSKIEEMAAEWVDEVKTIMDGKIITATRGASDFSPKLSAKLNTTVDGDHFSAKLILEGNAQSPKALLGRIAVSLWEVSGSGSETLITTKFTMQNSPNSAEVEFKNLPIKKGGRSVEYKVAIGPSRISLYSVLKTKIDYEDVAGEEIRIDGGEKFGAFSFLVGEIDDLRWSRYKRRNMLTAAGVKEFLKKRGMIVDKDEIVTISKRSKERISYLLLMKEPGSGVRLPVLVWSMKDGADLNMILFGRVLKEADLGKIVDKLAVEDPKRRIFTEYMAGEGRSLLVPKSSSAGQHEMLLFDPGLAIADRTGLREAVVTQDPAQPERAQDTRELVGSAPEPLRISVPLRIVDGPGSSLDIRKFGERLTPKEAKELKQIPATPTFTSTDRIVIRIEKADDPDSTEYIVPKKYAKFYGMPKDGRYVVKGDVELTGEGLLPKGQKDAAAFIFSNVFKLKGYRIVVEEIPIMALWGGVESSSAFNLALTSVAGMLAEEGSAWSDIFGDIFDWDNGTISSGPNGGQGTLASYLGGAYLHHWLAGMKDDDGHLLNSVSAMSMRLLEEEDYEFFESRMAIVQPGKELMDGLPVVGRTATLTNDMWTDLLVDEDPEAMKLFEKMPELAYQYTQGIINKDMRMVINAVVMFELTRDSLCKRWVTLALMPDGERPEYADKYAEKLKTDDVLRKYHEELGGGLRDFSMYSGDQSDFIMRGASKGVALMPLGAGGIGANYLLVASSPEARDAFLKEEGLDLLTDETVEEALASEGERVLRGYKEFEISADGIRFKGFDKIGIQEPVAPARIIYDEDTGGMSLAKAASAGEAIARAKALLAKVATNGPASLLWKFKAAYQEVFGAVRVHGADIPLYEKEKIKGYAEVSVPDIRSFICDSLEFDQRKDEKVLPESVIRIASGVDKVGLLDDYPSPGSKPALFEVYLFLTRTPTVFGFDKYRPVILRTLRNRDGSYQVRADYVFDASQDQLRSIIDQNTSSNSQDILDIWNLYFQVSALLGSLPDHRFNIVADALPIKKLKDQGLNDRQVLAHMRETREMVRAKFMISPILAIKHDEGRTSDTEEVSLPERTHAEYKLSWALAADSHGNGNVLRIEVSAENHTTWWKDVALRVVNERTKADFILPMFQKGATTAGNEMSGLSADSYKITLAPSVLEGVTVDKASSAGAPFSSRAMNIERAVARLHRKDNLDAQEITDMTATAVAAIAELLSDAEIKAGMAPIKTTLPGDPSVKVQMRLEKRYANIYNLNIVMYRVGEAALALDGIRFSLKKKGRASMRCLSKQVNEGTAIAAFDNLFLDAGHSYILKVEPSSSSINIDRVSAIIEGLPSERRSLAAAALDRAGQALGRRWRWPEFSKKWPHADAYLEKSQAVNVGGTDIAIDRKSKVAFFDSFPTMVAKGRPSTESLLARIVLPRSPEGEHIIKNSIFRIAFSTGALPQYEIFLGLSRKPSDEGSDIYRPVIIRIFREFEKRGDKVRMHINYIEDESIDYLLAVYVDPLTPEEASKTIEVWQEFNKARMRAIIGDEILFIPQDDQQEAESRDDEIRQFLRRLLAASSDGEISVVVQSVDSYEPLANQFVIREGAGADDRIEAIVRTTGSFGAVILPSDFFLDNRELVFDPGMDDQLRAWLITMFIKLRADLHAVPGSNNLRVSVILQEGQPKTWSLSKLKDVAEMQEFVLRATEQEITSGSDAVTIRDASKASSGGDQMRSFADYKRIVYAVNRVLSIVSRAPYLSIGADISSPNIYRSDYHRSHIELYRLGASYSVSDAGHHYDDVQMA